LLAARLKGFFRGVPNAHDELVRCLGALQRGGDVEQERCVAALVGADADIVDEDIRADVEQDVFARPVFGEGEPAFIPEFIFVADRLLDAGERGLDGKVDEDFPNEDFWLGAPFRGDGVVPESVEVEPFRADEARARVAARLPADGMEL